MMNINSLIDKYGEAATKNGSAIVAYIAEENVSVYKKDPQFDEHTGFYFINVLIKEGVLVTDSFVIGGTNYLVYTFTEIRKKGERVYTDCVLFKNDFSNSVSFYKQQIKNTGFNLPSQNSTAYLTGNVRIRTVKTADYKQYSLYTDKVVTHKISMLYSGMVGVGDLMKFGSRKFEILSYENVDEQNRLLVLDAIEVL